MIASTSLLPDSVRLAKGHRRLLPLTPARVLQRQRFFQRLQLPSKSDQHRGTPLLPRLEGYSANHCSDQVHVHCGPSSMLRVNRSWVTSIRMKTSPFRPSFLVVTSITLAFKLVASAYGSCQDCIITSPGKKNPTSNIIQSFLLAACSFSTMLLGSLFGQAIPGGPDDNVSDISPF
ncbi:hypothetical protein BJ875DRAFT_159 [Amylocarpus encephaloides]|uniref:Uncharacterized protein n=1 Tax=Amylocarpus encephaloides TaxID=45428 RepID=A0A9P7YV60_9HELO|nr:hypothetical protein BJ875DRAFT_159 [Amylocarpus encephaloides]